MKLRPYTDADAGKWDELAGRSPLGTFLHTRRFLSYHGARFADRSLVCEDREGGIAAIFPAALKPDEPETVVSHPGATYGGLLYDARARAGEVEDMVAGLVAHYRSEGLKRLEYKSVPLHFQRAPAQADLRAISMSGGALVRRDLWSVLSLSDGVSEYSSRHRRAIAKAGKERVVARVDDSDLAYRDYYAMLVNRLDERYQVQPVHALDEMRMLRDRFPADIRLWCALGPGERLLAGCWVFQFGEIAWHTQYIASNEEGRARRATHLLFDAMIREAAGRRVRNLSFGCFTEDGGRRVNAGLEDFKSEFGAGTVCHDTYLLALTS